MSTSLEGSESEIVFPFESKLSFTNVIVFWQIRALDVDPLKSETAKKVLEEVERIPELLLPIDDMTVLEKHKSVIDLLFTAIFSPFTEEEEIVSAMTPYKMEEIHSTKGYRSLTKNAAESDIKGSQLQVQQIMKYKILSAYSAILNLFYDEKLDSTRDIIYTLENPDSGLTKFYRTSISAKYCEIIPKGELPILNEADIDELKDNFDNLDFWKEKLPPELFEFQGIAIFRMSDVTKEEILSRLKEQLLKKDSISNEESFVRLRNMFRSLLNRPDIRLGITGYDKNKNCFINLGNSEKRSMLLGEEKDMTCDTTNRFLYKQFIKSRESIVIHNTAECYSEIGVHAQTVIDSGVKNLMLIPLYSSGNLVGILELGSPNRRDLDASVLAKIKDVFPLFAIAVKRHADEVENSVRSIIRKKYTSIHPTVEWKFNEAAYQMLDQVAEGKNPVTPHIVFKEVYPLYAASDIRNSTLARNQAINKDLNKQLGLAKGVLEKAMRINNLPILDKTIFRLDQFKNKIKDQLVSGDEASVLEFLQNDVEPLIKNFETNEIEFKKISKEYWSALDPTIQVVYEERKNFEDSLTQINKTIGDILDDEEKKSQKMFPHFFERYKTDGVEHNIYIGESLVENMQFDEIYLQNLRLWQLVVTTEIANRVAELAPELSLPLETTHLILVHSKPLSIRFRLDEKRFDVDGAYNIRYEIIKKRIDKALVKGTEERITQPGKIAIVYAHENDAYEYNKYIEYLKDKGLLLGETEMLEVEELQGVSGLKCLRVTVNIGTSAIMAEVKKLLEMA